MQGRRRSLNIDVGTGKSNVIVSKSGGSHGSAYQPAKPVVKDDVIQINLAGYTGQLSLYWARYGTSGETVSPSSAGCPGDTNGAAAVEVMIIQNATGNYAINRYNYVPAGCSTATNGFTVGQSSNLPEFAASALITVPANAAIMRIRPLYNMATLRIVPPATASLPVQAYKIRSEGTTGDTKRVVEVEKSIGGLPSIFDYVLYNGCATQTLTKDPAVTPCN